MRHPVQPLIIDKHGVVRFKENRIVTHMWSSMMSVGGVDFHDHFLKTDNEQLSQLTGITFNMFKDLPFASPETIAIADTMYREKISEDKARIQWLEKRVKELEGDPQ